LQLYTLLKKVSEGEMEKKTRDRGKEMLLDWLNKKERMDYRYNENEKERLETEQTGVNEHLVGHVKKK